MIIELHGIEFDCSVEFIKGEPATFSEGAIVEPGYPDDLYIYHVSVNGSPDLSAVLSTSILDTLWDLALQQLGG